jgi:D-alanine-D-alanine ligase
MLIDAMRVKINDKSIMVSHLNLIKTTRKITTKENNMYICVLSSTPEANDIPYDPSPYMNGYRWKQHLVASADVDKQIRNLMDEGVDTFVNLCDGTPDDGLSGIALVHVLEKYNAAFTGADSKFFDPTRDEMKNAAKRVSVPTPNWTFVNRVEDAEKVVKRLKFPMLVKPPHGYASVGIRRNSRVTDIEQLREQLKLEIEEFGRALIEEFIDGREFTCLIAENPDDPKKPLTFTPVEFIFPSGESFKHYDMKWVEYEKMSVAVVNDPKIEKTLREQTMRVFKELNGNGYARCDYRMDADGVIHMLEINPNCGIFYPPHEPGSADFSLLNDPVTNHTKFMKMIVHNAHNRRNRIAAEKVVKRQPRKRVIEVEQMAYS